MRSLFSNNQVSHRYSSPNFSDHVSFFCSFFFYPCFVFCYTVILENDKKNFSDQGQRWYSSPDFSDGGAMVVHANLATRWTDGTVPHPLPLRLKWSGGAMVQHHPTLIFFIYFFFNKETRQTITLVLFQIKKCTIQCVYFF